MERLQKVIANSGYCSRRKAEELIEAGQVYVDGELVFDDDVEGDLSQVIFEIIEKFLGEHEIKVEFTDADGKTNTYKENIIIE